MTVAHIRKVMVEQGYGVILNISSMNSFRPLTRIPAYSAAKAAVGAFRPARGTGGMWSTKWS